MDVCLGNWSQWFLGWSSFGWLIYHFPMPVLPLPPATNHAHFSYYKKVSSILFSLSYWIFATMFSATTYLCIWRHESPFHLRYKCCWCSRTTAVCWLPFIYRLLMLFIYLVVSLKTVVQFFLISSIFFTKYNLSSHVKLMIFWGFHARLTFDFLPDDFFSEFCSSPMSLDPCT